MEILNTVLNFFITNAYAEAATAAPTPIGSSNFSMMIMLGVFIVFMYFVVWRPQNKRMKEQRDLLNSLTKGDEVVTAGGILGTIAKLADNYVVLKLADNVEITLQKTSIVNVLPKGTLKSI